MERTTKIVTTEYISISVENFEVIHTSRTQQVTTTQNTGSGVETTKRDVPITENNINNLIDSDLLNDLISKLKKLSTTTRTFMSDKCSAPPPMPTPASPNEQKIDNSHPGTSKMSCFQQGDPVNTDGTLDDKENGNSDGDCGREDNNNTDLEEKIHPPNAKEETFTLPIAPFMDDDESGIEDLLPPPIEFSSDDFSSSPKIVNNNDSSNGEDRNDQTGEKQDNSLNFHKEVNNDKNNDDEKLNDQTDEKQDNARDFHEETRSLNNSATPYGQVQSMTTTNVQGTFQPPNNVLKLTTDSVERHSSTFYY